VPWLRDLLPDMLWIVYHLAHDATAGMALVARVLDSMDDALATVAVGPSINDGRLTSFEEIPDQARPLVMARLHATGMYGIGFPETWAQALAVYPNAPGRWLVEPRLDRIHPSAQAAESVLEPIVRHCLHGQAEVPTRAKALVLRGRFKARKISLSSGIDLEPLTRYPSDITEDERRRLEPTIRAMFLAFLDDASTESAVRWAQNFWRTNWIHYSCRRRDHTVPAADIRPIEQAANEFRTLSQSLEERFRTVVNGATPDLYAPDRNEVLTGIAARAVQLAISIAGSPVLWSPGIGMPIVRAIIEAHIVLNWLMHTEETDPTVYLQFKEYGRGQLKLYKLHMEEFADSLQDPPPGLAESIETLDRQVNEDVMEWVQDIPLGAVFKKQDLRKMATAVKMETLYRLGFQPASSETHGEWPAIDRSVLERCLHPLHGGHRILSQQLEQPIGAHLAAMILQLAEELVDAYEAGTGGDAS
jgi:Family of unknown function (DUF5677)